MTYYDIDPIKSGDTLDEIVFEYIVDGIAVDLTGATIKCKFRRANASGIVVKDFTSGDGISILSPATDGKYQIDAQIFDVPPGKYVYDIEVTYDTTGLGDYKTYTDVRGSINIVEKVSRDE